MTENEVNGHPKWDSIMLGELAEDITTGFPCGDHNDEQRGVPHLRPMNIDREGHIELSDVKYIEEEDYDKLEPGDILFNNTNSTELVGKTALVQSNKRWGFSNHMTRIRVNSNIIQPAWVAYYLHYLFYKGFFRKKCKSYVNQANVNKSLIEEGIPVLLPPIETQKQILDKIEKLMSKLDSGVKQLNNVGDKLDSHKTAMREVAASDELTAKWRRTNPSSKSTKNHIEKINQDRYGQWKKYEEENKKKRGESVETDRWKKKYTPPVGITVDDLPELPDSWTWVTLDTLTAYDVDYRGKTPPYSDSGIPVISSGNVQNGKIKMDDPKYVSEETYEEWLTRGVPEPGDLLITTEAPPGDTALFPDDKKYLPTRRIITFKTVGVNNRYLQLCFNYSVVEKYIHRNSRGTTVDRILKDVLFETPIPLPPLSEQKEIVNRISKHETVIEDTTTSIKQGVSKANKMRPSILNEAFQGELVDSEIAHEEEYRRSNQTDEETIQLRLEDV